MNLKEEGHWQFLTIVKYLILSLNTGWHNIDTLSTPVCSDSSTSATHQELQDRKQKGRGSSVSWHYAVCAQLFPGHCVTMLLLNVIVSLGWKKKQLKHNQCRQDTDKKSKERYIWRTSGDPVTVKSEFLLICNTEMLIKQWLYFPSVLQVFYILEDSDLFSFFFFYLWCEMCLCMYCRDNNKSHALYLTLNTNPTGQSFRQRQISSCSRAPASICPSLQVLCGPFGFFVFFFRHYLLL